MPLKRIEKGLLINSSFNMKKKRKDCVEIFDNSFIQFYLSFASGLKKRIINYPIQNLMREMFEMPLKN